MSEPESFANIPMEVEPELPKALRNIEIAKAGARRAELYFVDLPELYERYLQVRKDLLKMFRNITRQAFKNAPGIYLHAKHFEAKMRVHINDFLLEFLSLLGLRENPAVQGYFRQPNRIPPVRVYTRRAYQIAAKRGEAVPDGFVIDLPEGDPSAADGLDEMMGIYDSPYTSSSSENFESVIVHEVIHALVDVPLLQSQRALHEGVTEMITQRLTGKFGRHSYKAETELATALMKLDREALFTWYVGCDNRAFHVRVEEKLHQHHTPDRAAKIAHWVANLTATEEMLFERAEELVPMDRDDPRYFKALRQYVDSRMALITAAIQKR